MIEMKNETMTDAQIKDYLRDVMPWLATDSNVSMLRGCIIDNIANEIARKEGSLIIAPDYHNAWREHLSIYPDAQEGFAFRKAFFEKKKAGDEAHELVTLRAQFFDPKYGSKIIVDGSRRPLASLTLTELRKAKADVDNFERIKGMSAREIVADNAANRPVRPRRSDGYPIMPRQLVVPAGVRVGDTISDGIHATEMTPQVIQGLTSSRVESNEYHYYRFRLVRAYGAAQVNERSQG
jgi:hypothetical protein